MTGLYSTMTQTEVDNLYRTWKQAKADSESWRKIMQPKPRAIQNVEVEDVFTWDYPDFCDAYVSYAEHLDGTPYTDAELEELNEDRDFVYAAVESWIY